MEAEIDFGQLGTIGVIADRPGNVLPPEAWTTANNMRIVDGVPRRLLGRSQIWGTPGVAPHFLMHIAAEAAPWWLYTSLTKGYVYDGSTHTNITRTSGGDYTAASTRDWNGTILGGIPILNNGADIPQFWASYSTGTKLANLTNWPASLRAKTVRAFGPQLVAFNCSKSGTVYPHLVKWSHSADPGALPSSWDETDPELDTGENDLPDVESGIIVDAAMLRGNMYVFKESSVWRMRYIGGRFIYAFDTYLETAGLLTQRCVVNLGRSGRQVFLTQDDLIIHNGSSQEGLLDSRWRRTLFNDIDVANYRNTFMFENPAYSEVWICYPAGGSTQPNRALIWNYQSGAGAFTTTDINFRNVAVGINENAEDGDWEVNEDEWEADEVEWGASERRRTIVCNTDSTKFLMLDSGNLNDTAGYTSTLQRTELALLGKTRTGTIQVEFKKQKMVRRIWINASGGPIHIRVGASNTVGGVVRWGPEVIFDPETQLYVDVLISGKALAIEFEVNDAVPWVLESYKLEFQVQGTF
jgi:hypothetical protein